LIDLRIVGAGLLLAAPALAEQRVTSSEPGCVSASFGEPGVAPCVVAVGSVRVIATAPRR
jgi:hypothetical protein